MEGRIDKYTRTFIHLDIITRIKQIATTLQQIYIISKDKNNKILIASI